MPFSRYLDLRYAGAVMRRSLRVLAVSVTLIGLAGILSCGSSTESKTSETVAPTAKLRHPEQEDLSRYMPKENRVSTSVTEGNLFENENLPRATVAEYKTGAKTYQQFLFKAQNPGMAAVYLGHAKDAMANAKFVAGFGGYFGEVGGKPVFVFVKNEYVTGLVGLSREDADAEGRLIAVRIP